MQRMLYDDDDDDDVTVHSEAVCSSAAGSGRPHRGQCDAVVAVSRARRRIANPRLRDRVPRAGWNGRLDQGQARRLQRHPRRLRGRTSRRRLVPVPRLRRD